MTTSAAVQLGAIVRAAAWDGRRVWAVAGDTLAAFEPDGRPVLERQAPGRLGSLAAGPEGIVGVAEPGVVVWLDGTTGDELARRPLGGETVLVGGRDGLFAVDAASERAWPVAGAGSVGPPVAIPGVERAAAARGAIWWTSPADTVLRGNGMEVDLGALAERRAGMVGCAGSVWVSVQGALLRVGAWGGDTSPPLAAPFGPVALACGDGRLVGASRQGVFVLDPSVDADVRRLQLDFGMDDDPAVLVATKVSAWLFSSTEPLARVVPYY